MKIAVSRLLLALICLLISGVACLAENGKTEFPGKGDINVWRKANVYGNRSLAAGNAGRIDEAILNAHKAIAIYPYDGIYHHDLGRALVKAKRLPEAEAEFRTAVKLTPQYWEIWEDFGNLLYDRGKLKDSRLAFLECNKYNPPAAKRAEVTNAIKQLDSMLAKRNVVSAGKRNQ